MNICTICTTQVTLDGTAIRLPPFIQTHCANIGECTTIFVFHESVLPPKPSPTDPIIVKFRKPKERSVCERESVRKTYIATVNIQKKGLSDSQQPESDVALDLCVEINLRRRKGEFTSAQS